MRRRQNEQMRDLATIESELTALKDMMGPQSTLLNTIAEQEKRISELERQLHDERSALGIIRGQIAQHSRAANAVKLQLQQSESAKDKAEATAATERASRVEAERKLKEYVDA